MPYRRNSLNKTLPFLVVLLPLALLPILLAISSQGARSAPSSVQEQIAAPAAQLQATATTGEQEPESDEVVFQPPSDVELLAAALDWVPVGPGIEYRKFHLPTPNNVFVARMSRDPTLAEQVTLESAIAQGKLASGKETVQSIAARYDQALNFWGQSYDPPEMGTRNQVVVAINGSYFDPYTGIPDRGVVQSGWYAKRFTDNQNGSGFVWNLDRQPFIGGCVSHPAGKNILIFIDSTGGYEEEMLIDGVNVPREDNELILYTPQYDSETNTDNKDSMEVLVRMDEPDLISKNATIEASAKGTVVQIRHGQGSTPIPFDHVVLSAQGGAVDYLDDYIEVGDNIAISQKVKDVDATEGICSGSLSAYDWADAYAALGGDFHFLKNGVVYPYSSNGGAWPRHPRTAIAFNSEYIYFIVVDGRDPFVSVGMSIGELGNFAKDVLGAVEGISQDGGGSSTMVINGKVVNNTYCNNVFCEGRLYVPLLSKPPKGTQTGAGQAGEPAGPFSLTTEEELTHSPAFAVAEANTPLQRLVANGMMMVAVAGPDINAAAFGVGEPVVTTGEAAVRLGPGDNYAAPWVLPSGSIGEIADHLNGLNGIFVKNATWWFVDFNDSPAGWVRQSQLASQSAFSPIPESLWSFR